jgi:hypothetical protein
VDATRNAPGEEHPDYGFEPMATAESRARAGGKKVRSKSRRGDPARVIARALALVAGAAEFIPARFVRVAFVRRGTTRVLHYDSERNIPAAGSILRACSIGCCV